MHRPLCTIVMLAAASVLATEARAQQTTITPAATQPGREVLINRTLVRLTHWDVSRADDGFSDVTELRSTLSFAYGLSGDWSILANIPVVHRNFDGLPGNASDDPTGLGDPTIEVKHRFINEPLGPVDTLRVAWFAGAELPLGRDEFSSDSVDPYVGLAVTRITGRLGLGAGLSYKATTGSTDRPLHPGDSSADLIRATGSLAWRFHPEEWGHEREAAWYLTLEGEVDYETSGEWMAALAPGILLEAPDYALELVVVIPVMEEEKRRPEHELGIIAGIRFFF